MQAELWRALRQFALETVPAVAVRCDFLCDGMCERWSAFPPRSLHLTSKLPSACIINQDGWGGKHVGRRSNPSTLHLRLCVCAFPCVYWCQDRQRAGKRKKKAFEAKVIQRQGLTERGSCLSVFFVVARMHVC